MGLFCLHPTFIRLVVVSVLVGLCCTACTRAELVDKADAYDQAIWDASNKQILLNAVRASQRAPMSFVGYGDVLATPNFSGSAGTTVNLSPAGLSNYSLNPSVNYAGGFSSFTINNLNHEQFASKMRHAVNPNLVDYFHRLSWPDEMVDLLLINSIVLSPSEWRRLVQTVQTKCKTDKSRRTDEICARLREDAAADDDCLARRLITEGPLILNSAREFCTMNHFQYTLRLYRLLEIRKFPAIPRTPEGMLYFLGELVAAQNYSSQQYTPKLYISAGGTHRLVDLIVVQRGVSATAAVQVFLAGEGFFIPRPDFGSADEARSLQVLDLVSQAIVMATSKEDLPKTNAVSLIAVR